MSTRLGLDIHLFLPEGKPRRSPIDGQLCLDRGESRMILPVFFPKLLRVTIPQGGVQPTPVVKVDEVDHCQICLREGLEFVAGQTLLHDPVERFDVGVLVGCSIRYPFGPTRPVPRASFLVVGFCHRRAQSRGVFHDDWLGTHLDKTGG